MSDWIPGQLDGPYKYVTHDRVRDYLDLGWVFVCDLGRPHGTWSVYMRWLCDCPLRMPAENAAEMIRVQLSFPPSVNNLFANGKKGRGRFSTRGYEAWKEENGWEIKRQRPGAIRGPVRVDIQLQTGRKQDCSNCIKAVEDLLVDHGVIEGDGHKHVKDIRARFVSGVTGAVVEIFPIVEGRHDR